MIETEHPHDVIHRFTLASDQLRGEIVTLETAFLEATAHQRLPPPVKALLGEFLAAAALLGEVLKFDGTLTLQVRGDGAIPLMMAEVTSQRTLRGVAKVREGYSPEGSIQSQLQTVFGNAVLTLTIDPTKGKRYQGIVPLEGDTLAACLNHYFNQSEQLPTRLWLFSDGAIPAGILLQQLPEAANVNNTPELFATAEHLADTVKTEELAQLSHATVLFRLFHELEVTLFSAQPVVFRCSCSEQRSATALKSLGEADAMALAHERGSIEMDCEFCGAHYQFTPEVVANLFNPKPTHH